MSSETRFLLQTIVCVIALASLWQSSLWTKVIDKRGNVVAVPPHQIGLRVSTGGQHSKGVVSLPLFHKHKFQQDFAEEDSSESRIAVCGSDAASSVACGWKRRGRRLTNEEVNNATRRRNSTMALHGAVKDFGYFYSTIYLGNPPRKFSVIVDTGSTMTYVPCSTCGKHCGPNHQDQHTFDPADSLTSKSISCHSEDCKCGSPICSCSEKEECMYTRSYAEQSSSSGILLEDIMHIHDGGRGVPVMFGCETRETGAIYKQRADGMLGLGNSKDSLIQQLFRANVIENQFSLCFGLVEGDGVLLLGESPALLDVNLSYTPLVDSPTNGNYYTLQMESIQVDDNNLEIESSTFTSGYSTVLDSGTTFTYFPTEMYRLFTETISSYVVGRGLFSVPGPDPQFQDVCFGGAPLHSDLEGLRRVFPTVRMRFKGDIELDLAPLQYLFIHTFESGKYCLAVFDNGNSGILLGGITFRNILVQYDLVNKRIGFGHASCKDLSAKYRPPCTYFKLDGLGDSLTRDALEAGDCIDETRDHTEEEWPSKSTEDVYEDLNDPSIVEVNPADHMEGDIGDSEYLPDEDSSPNTVYIIVSGVFGGIVVLSLIILGIVLAVKKAREYIGRNKYHILGNSQEEDSNFSTYRGSLSPMAGYGAAHNKFKPIDDGSKGRNIQLVSSPRDSIKTPRTK